MQKRNVTSNDGIAWSDPKSVAVCMTKIHAAAKMVPEIGLLYVPADQIAYLFKDTKNILCYKRAKKMEELLGLHYYLLAYLDKLHTDNGKKCQQLQSLMTERNSLNCPRIITIPNERNTHPLDRNTIKKKSSRT